MKILFLVANMNSGGSERTVAYLSNYLSRNNYEISIISMDNVLFYDLDSSVGYRSLNIPSRAKGILKRMINAIKRTVNVNYAVVQEHPDVVFCMLPYAAKHILFMKKFYNYCLLSSERNLPQVGDLRLKMKVFNACEGVVFQTERAKTYYPESIQEKGMVIPNAVGNNRVEDCHRSLKTDNTISAIGRLTDAKDYPTLLRAFEVVSKKHSDIKLNIYGDGPEKNNLITLTEKLGIKNSVNFCGAKKDALILAQNSLCYVLSSKYEGMPNSLMEAMAIGLPCISTDCPNGPAELIENEINGLLVPVGDYKLLADAIERMIMDTCFANKCSNEAKKILNTNSVEIIASKYAEFINKTYQNYQSRCKRNG